MNTTVSLILVLNFIAPPSDTSSCSEFDVFDALNCQAEPTNKESNNTPKTINTPVKTEKKVCKREDFNDFDDYVDCQMKVAKESPEVYEAQQKETSSSVESREMREVEQELAKPSISSPSLNHEMRESVKSELEVEAWEKRDNTLTIATALTGTVFIISTLVSVVLSVKLTKDAEKVVDTCLDAVDDPFDRGGLQDCESQSKKVAKTASRFYIPMVALSTTSAISGAGFLISGISLGVHHSRKPKALLAIKPTGLQIRF